MTTQAELWAIQKKESQSTEIANELRARAAREDERAAEYRKQLGLSAGTEVEELAATLNDAAAPYYYPFDWTEATGIAASLLAAGYRKPQQVTTAVELAALPRFTVIRSAEGTVFERQSMWHEAGSRALMAWPDIPLPVTVLQLGWGEE